jgi:hypothetical protein
MASQQSQCLHHEAHDLRIARNENKHVIAAAAILETRETVSRWKWIMIGFAACGSLIVSISGVMVGVMWWIIGNKFVMDAIVKARG